MKARIAVMSSKQKREVLKELELEYAKVRDREQNDFSRRVFKMVLYCLNTDFGFGVKRLARLMECFESTMEKMKDDEVFWEHIDRVVIDGLGLQFERDYTDRGKAARFDDRKQNEEHGD